MTEKNLKAAKRPDLYIYFLVASRRSPDGKLGTKQTKTCGRILGYGRLQEVRNRNGWEMEVASKTGDFSKLFRLIRFISKGATHLSSFCMTTGQLFPSKKIERCAEHY